MMLVKKAKILIFWMTLTISVLLVQRKYYRASLNQGPMETKFESRGIDLLVQSESNEQEVDDEDDTDDADDADDGLEFPFHPFVEGQPRSVVVLSYQRCGSSFFADLFNKNPDAFYTFEPIDSVYSAMYGTQPGWNVPSDITSYANGTERLLPDWEISEVSRILRHLLTCDLNHLPVEQLAHHFLKQSFYQRPNDYVRCLSNRTFFNQRDKCYKLAPTSYCGQRFGTKNETRQHECYRILADSKTLKTHPNRTMFLPFSRCKQKLRKAVLSGCGAAFSKVCNRDLRSVKTVRATMKSMDPLLSTLPNFRVIHLMRDPRAVMLSRKKFDSSAMGLYSFNYRNGLNMSREAEIFCRTVYQDVIVRKELEKRFPGKIYPLVYEDVMADLKSYSERVYSFMGLASPVNSTWWKKQIWRGGKEATTIPHKWKSTLTFADSKAISQKCKELFKLLNKWET